jgi:hypothetical protein
MLSFAVEYWLSKMHNLQENSRKGGRKTQEKRAPKELFAIICLLFFLRCGLSGLQILPDPVLRRGYVHPSQGSE